MIKAVALTFGYVESNTLSWLVFESEYNTPKTKKQALLSLAEFLYQKFMGRRRTQPDCAVCNTSLADNPSAKYCSECGMRLRSVGFYYYEWLDFLEGVRTSDIDGFHYSDDTDNPHGWDASLFAFGLPDKKMLIVQEHAAEMLSLAVAELHPEVKLEVDKWLIEEYKELLKEKKK